MNWYYYHEAQIELTKAAEFYDAAIPGLGGDLIREVDQAIEAILEAPLRWAKTYSDCRKYNLNRFPFGIIYLVTDHQLVIIAVAHHSRKPGYWRDRL